MIVNIISVVTISCIIKYICCSQTKVLLSVGVKNTFD